MSDTNTGGPAFPEVPGDCNAYEGKSGMSLRDYFAAKAMQSQLGGYISATADNPSMLDAIATNAYAMAEAMLKARKS